MSPPRPQLWSWSSLMCRWTCRRTPPTAPLSLATGSEPPPPPPHAATVSTARDSNSFIEIFMESPPTRKVRSDDRAHGPASHGVHATRYFGGRRYRSNGAVKGADTRRGRYHRLRQDAQDGRERNRQRGRMRHAARTGVAEFAVVRSRIGLGVSRANVLRAGAACVCRGRRRRSRCSRRRRAWLQPSHPAGSGTRAGKCRTTPKGPAGSSAQSRVNLNAGTPGKMHSRAAADHAGIDSAGQMPVNKRSSAAMIA